HAGLAKLSERNRGLGESARQVQKFVSELNYWIAGHVTAAMRRCYEDHSRHERLRFEEHRARGEVARLGIEFRLVKRDRRDVVPEAIAAFDDHHLCQEPALAVADHYHLVER